MATLTIMNRVNIFAFISSIFTIFAYIMVVNLISPSYHPLKNRVTEPANISIALTGDTTVDFLLLSLTVTILFMLIPIIGLRSRITLASTILLTPLIILSFSQNPINLSVIYIALGFSAIIAILSYEKRADKVIELLVRIGLFSLTVLSAIALGSIFSLLTLGISSLEIMHISTLSPNILYSFFWPTMIIFIILLFSWIIRIWALDLLRWLKNYVLSWKTFGKVKEETIMINFEKKWKTWLLLIMASSLILGIYPLLHGVNPDSQSVSVDAVYYDLWLGELEGKGISDTIVLSFTEIPALQNQQADRPIALLIMRLIQWSFGLTTDQITPLMLTILNPFFVLISYFLVLEGTGKRGLSILAAGLTAFSPFSLANIYTGFIGNWLAINSIFIMIIFIIRYIKSASKRYFVLSITTGLIISLLHPYSWLETLGILILFATIGVIYPSTNYLYRIRQYLLSISIVTVGLIFDIARYQLTGISQVVNVLGKTGPFFDQNFIYNFWNGVILSFEFYAGGALYSPIIITAAFLGIFYLKTNRILDNLLLIWIFATSIIMFLSIPWAQFRLLLNLPLIIIASFGLEKIIIGLESFPLISKHVKPSIPFILFLITSQISYTLFLESNFVP